MMDEVREMARDPIAIFERFVRGLQRLTSEQALAGPGGMERLGELQAATLREVEESFQRFRGKVGEAEAQLGATLRSPRPSLAEELADVSQRLQRLGALLGRRDQLFRAWEEQAPEAIVEGYQAALVGREPEVVDLFEAEAERFLRRKGDAGALQTFLALRAQAARHRATPAQQQARADLEELESLKRQIALAARLVGAAVKVSGNVAAQGTGRRLTRRLRLARTGGADLLALIFPGPHPGMTARVLDLSRSGLQLEIPEEVVPGAQFRLVVKAAAASGAEVRLQGEVRWCRPDESGRRTFRAGVRLAPSEAPPGWFALVNRLAGPRAEGPPAVEPRPNGATPRPTA